MLSSSTWHGRGMERRAKRQDAAVCHSCFLTHCATCCLAASRGNHINTSAPHIVHSAISISMLRLVHDQLRHADISGIIFETGSCCCADTANMVGGAKPTACQHPRQFLPDRWQQPTSSYGSFPNAISPACAASSFAALHRQDNSSAFGYSRQVAI